MRRREFITLLGGGCVAGRGARSNKKGQDADEATARDHRAVIDPSTRPSTHSRRDPRQAEVEALVASAARAFGLPKWDHPIIQSAPK